MWGTVYSNEYYTDFCQDEPVLLQIGEKQCAVSRVEVDDAYLFLTVISGKPIEEFDGERVFLTGTITYASEDFSLVKFYALREGVPGTDTPYIDASAEQEIEIAGLVRYNAETTLCDILLEQPTELTAIDGYTAVAEMVRV